jgi:hypothetical protein
MTPPKRLLWISLVAIGLTAACGGGSSPSAASSSTASSGSSSSPSASTGTSSSSASSSTPASGDACSLITDEEVAAVIGVPVTRNEPATQTGAIGCVKGTDRNADVAKGAFVSYSQFTVGGEQVLDQFGSESDAEEVTGLGDRAVFEASAGLVFFSANGKVASMQVFKFGQVGGRDEVIALAKLLLPRLP